MTISILLGILLIGIGLCVHVFKMYWLISGYNMLTEKRKKSIDIDKIARAIGMFLYSLGLFTMVLSFYNSFIILILYVLYTLLGGICLTIFYEKNDKSRREIKDI